MKYLEPSFSHFAVGSEDYRDNWDRIFEKDKVIEEEPKPTVEDLLLEVATALEIASYSTNLAVLRQTCVSQAERLREALV